MPAHPRKTCFVIGPMGHGQLERLKWLADEVLQPILGEDYVVFTPDVSEVGNIMSHIIRSCDRAELVVADTTGNNPNVLYEMAILDAMGRACVPVKFKVDDQDEKMAFDRSLYRYFVLEQETQSAQKKLREVIEDVKATRERGDLFSNPITDYFDDPLNSLASARGVARGYFRNFITPCLNGKVIHGPDFAIGKSGLQVQTILPNRLHQATRPSVEKVFRRGVFKEVIVEAKGRPITAHVWTQYKADNGDPIIVDVPTAMAPLIHNVHARLGRGTTKNPESPDFRMLEDNEIGQFVRYLEIFSHEAVAHDDDHSVRDHYRRINVTRSFEPGLLD